MRVALVHEFLTQLGGAERVLEVFHELFPDAPVYTLVYDEQKTDSRFKGYDLRVSFLQKFYQISKSYKWLLPLMPRAIQSFDLSTYDLVLSDSSAFTKGVKVKKPAVHISYCHTPTRYLWQEMDDYVKAAIPPLVRPLVKPYLKHYLRKWDYRAAQRPGFLIANSLTVQKRIKQYYNRDSEVIYPPVDTEFFKGGNGRKGSKGEYYFTASRLEPYKKIDLVVEAFNRLNLPLKVAGDGTQAQSLKRKAKGNIEFLGRVSDEELRELYGNAKAFIFPALEDAGIMTLESLACGTPVIGFAKGGTAEFIKNEEHGVLFAEQTTPAISSAAKKLATMKFDPEKLRARALEFDKAKFKEKVRACVSALTP